MLKGPFLWQLSEVGYACKYVDNEKFWNLSDIYFSIWQINMKVIQSTKLLFLMFNGFIAPGRGGEWGSPAYKSVLLTYKVKFLSWNSKFG